MNRGNLSDYGFGKAPLNMTQKAPTIIKEKMYLLHFIKMKNICSSKDTKIGSSQTKRKRLQIYGQGTYLRYYIQKTRTWY